MQPDCYKNDLTVGSLMVREARVIAELLLTVADGDGWYRAIEQDNLLQKRAMATARRQSRALRLRLERLSPEFWELLNEGDEQLATQVAYCAAVARNLILMEFVEEVVADAFTTRAGELKRYQWAEFVADRAPRSEVITNWTEASVAKMGQVVLRILAEVGLIASTRNPEPTRLLVRPELQKLLNAPEYKRINACLNLGIG